MRKKGKNKQRSQANASGIPKKTRRGESSKFAKRKRDRGEGGKGVDRSEQF